MGNAALCAGKASKDAVTVLQADGNVLTFRHYIRVADLILEFPNHFVCHSSSLMLMQQGKILPLKTLLIPGEVYFLLPIPGYEVKDDGPVEDSETDSLLHREPPRRSAHISGSMKFVISTEQFSKILSGSVKDGGHRSKRRNQKRAPKVTKPATSWQPRLSSIEELAAN